MLNFRTANRRQQDWEMKPGEPTVQLCLSALSHVTEFCLRFFERNFYSNKTYEYDSQQALDFRLVLVIKPVHSPLNFSSLMANINVWQKFDIDSQSGKLGSESIFLSCAFHGDLIIQDIGQVINYTTVYKAFDTFICNVTCKMNSCCYTCTIPLSKQCTMKNLHHFSKPTHTQTLTFTVARTNIKLESTLAGQRRYMPSRASSFLV